MKRCGHLVGDRNFLAGPSVMKELFVVKAIRDVICQREQVPLGLESLAGVPGVELGLMVGVPFGWTERLAVD